MQKSYAANDSLPISVFLLSFLRLSMKTYRRNSSHLEIMESARFLVCTVSYLHAELLNLHHLHGIRGPSNDSLSRNPICNNLWDAQSLALSIMCDSLTGIVSSIPIDLWQSTIEVSISFLTFWFMYFWLLITTCFDRYWGKWWTIWHQRICYWKTLSCQGTFLVGISFFP